MIQFKPTLFSILGNVHSSTAHIHNLKLVINRSAELLQAGVGLNISGDDIILDGGVGESGSVELSKYTGGYRDFSPVESKYYEFEHLNYPWIDGDDQDILHKNRESITTYSSNFSWDDSIENSLRQIGFSNFRDNQRPLINAVMSQNDVLVVAPTSYGKSLLYQIPALCSGNMTTVCIVPTLAIMTSHAKKLNEFGIKNEAINNKTSKLQRDQIRKTIERDDNPIKVLFISPEGADASLSTINNMIYELSRADRISRIVVDEAHMIVSWGKNFRDSNSPIFSYTVHFPIGYSKIGRIKACTMLPVLALSATCTHDYQEEIVKSLRMHNPVIFRKSVDRPNIKYIHNSERPKKISTTATKITSVISKFPKNTNAIVFTNYKSMCTSLCEELKKNSELKQQVILYHGGVTDRETYLNKFVESDNVILVCTPSTGLGIDKKDLTLGFYVGCPKNLFNYVQCSGRLGRNGNNSFFHVMYRESDVASIMNKLNTVDEKKDLLKVYRILESAECIRRNILNEFGELLIDNCHNCCMCTDYRKTTTDVRYIVDAIQTYLSEVTSTTATDILDCIFNSASIETALAKINTQNYMRIKYNAMKSSKALGYLKYRYDQPSNFPEGTRSKLQKRPTRTKLPSRDFVQKVIISLSCNGHINVESKQTKYRVNYFNYSSNQETDYSTVFPDYEHFETFKTTKKIRYGKMKLPVPTMSSVHSGVVTIDDDDDDEEYPITLPEIPQIDNFGMTPTQIEQDYNLDDDTDFDFLQFDI